MHWIQERVCWQCSGPVQMPGNSCLTHVSKLVSRYHGQSCRIPSENVVVRCQTLDTLGRHPTCLSCRQADIEALPTHSVSGEQINSLRTKWRCACTSKFAPRLCGYAQCTSVRWRSITAAVFEWTGVNEKKSITCFGSHAWHMHARLQSSTDGVCVPLDYPGFISNPLQTICETIFLL